MNNFENKEKNLNNLLDKLGNLTASYSQSSYNSEKIKSEKNQLESEKKELEKKHDELIREHKYLKERLVLLQKEVEKRSDIEKKFNQDIDELSQETENLVEEIDKWQI
ncbi:5-formyltetrahydrofolate cyclo-ligase [Pelagibacteraceae bacterium]|nr:5-formyltetrahydrofolate cyclo-ligase [Pelagibacteraceae bacterium]